MNSYLVVLAALLAVRPVDAAWGAPAAQDTVVLQRVQIPGTDREMGMGIAEFAPNAAKPRQKAIGPEVVYVLSGELTVLVDGRAAKIVHAGESWRMPANIVHTTTAGPMGAKVVATWVWVPGKQFNIPAPH